MSESLSYKVYQRCYPENLVRIKAPGERSWRPFPITMEQAEKVAAGLNLPLTSTRKPLYKAVSGKGDSRGE